MKMTKALLGASLWIMLTGCQTVNADYDQPARIVNPDADSRAALQATVNEALGREVMLADDALTGSSMLVIERWLPGTMEDPVPQGRILEKPTLDVCTSQLDVGIDGVFSDHVDRMSETIDRFFPPD